MGRFWNPFNYGYWTYACIEMLTPTYSENTFTELLQRYPLHSFEITTNTISPTSSTATKGTVISLKHNPLRDRIIKSVKLRENSNSIFLWALNRSTSCHRTEPSSVLLSRKPRQPFPLTLRLKKPLSRRAQNKDQTFSWMYYHSYFVQKLLVKETIAFRTIIASNKPTDAHDSVPFKWMWTNTSAELSCCWHSHNHCCLSEPLPLNGRSSKCTIFTTLTQFTVLSSIASSAKLTSHTPLHIVYSLCHTCRQPS